MALTTINVQPRSTVSIANQEQVNGLKNKEKAAELQNIDKTSAIQAPKKDKVAPENPAVSNVAVAPVTIQAAAAKDLDKALDKAGKGSVENVDQGTGFLDRVKSFFGFGPSVLEPTEKIDNDINSFKNANSALSSRANLSNKNELSNTTDKMDSDVTNIRTADDAITGLGIVKSGLTGAGKVVTELASGAAQGVLGGVGLGFSVFSAAKSGNELRYAANLNSEAKAILNESPVEREKKSNHWC